MAKFARMETHPKHPKSATLFNGPKMVRSPGTATPSSPPRVAFRQIRRNPKTPQPVVSSLQPQVHLLRMNIALATKNDSVAHKAWERQKCETCSVALEMRLNLIHDAVCPAAKEIRLATVPMVQPITWCRKNFVQHHLGNWTSLAKAIFVNAIKQEISWHISCIWSYITHPPLSTLNDSSPAHRS